MFWDKVDIKSPISVNYDANKDGKMNGGNDPYKYFSGEDETIKNSVSAISNDYDKIVFIVKAPNLPGSGDVCGYTCKGNKYVFVSDISLDCPDPRITISHELGHALCKLGDLGPPYNSSTDTDNLMWGSFLSTKWRLRKNQWDLCNP